MDEIPLGVMIGVLIILLILSGFFSGSETGLMTLNRYRLRHRVKEGNRGARYAESLLGRPDRLLGLILFGNNLVNIAASVLAGVIAMRLYGEGALAWVPFALTPVVLIFAEVLPKTFAALHPERIAIPSAYVYYPMLRVFGWLIWLINIIANSLLRLFGVSPDKIGESALSNEELRTVVMEAGNLIPKSRKDMLLRILELEEATVEDVMVPRNEMLGVDLADDWSVIQEQLETSQHTRLPVYEETVDNIVGMLHLRQVFTEASRNGLTKERLRGLLQEPYFIPEATPLHRQLLTFQKNRRRIGLVVDEYGDIQGLVTMEDILEEIVGEFTTDPLSGSHDITAEPEGSYLVSGSVPIRTLNRVLHWDLPMDGPKTLNGLILETLETIPPPNTSVRIGGYPLEVVQSTRNTVKVVRVRPRDAEPSDDEDKPKTGDFTD